jgi:hypothetical protein
MNTTPEMTPDKLASMGRALYGDRWQTSLATELNIADRTIRRWMSGDSSIPDAVEPELRRRLIERVNEIGGMIGYSVHPSNSEIYHYPTGACFRFDEAGKLTLLNPAMLSPDQIPLITKGAEEALRQDRERDPSITWGWADRAGRFTQPEIEEEYKGYIISYPRIPRMSGVWTVNLGSNLPYLQAKLGPSTEVFNDYTNISGAIAQAKRRVDELT